jgi:hypothetical protein
MVDITGETTMISAITIQTTLAVATTIGAITLMTDDEKKPMRIATIVAATIVSALTARLYEPLAVILSLALLWYAMTQKTFETVSALSIIIGTTITSMTAYAASEFASGEPIQSAIAILIEVAICLLARDRIRVRDVAWGAAGTVLGCAACFIAFAI